MVCGYYCIKKITNFHTLLERKIYKSIWISFYDILDIINISKKIDCYDISIRPYEDCCTIFTNKNPKTKPKMKECEIIENKFDFTPLLNEAIENVELKVITNINNN